jgi:tRNA(adenine34) deaminase
MKVIAAARTEIERHSDVTRQAEMECIRRASETVGCRSLSGYTLYTTLEPNAMVLSALLGCQISRVFFGAWDPQSGVVRESLQLFTQSHCEVIGGVLENECMSLIHGYHAAKSREPPSLNKGVSWAGRGDYNKHKAQ